MGKIKKETADAIIKEALDFSDNAISVPLTLPKALNSLIDSYETLHTKYKTNYFRYMAYESGTPIKSRTLDNFMKINNQLNNSFMSEIIDTKLGYLIGIPIVYAVKSTKLEVDKADEAAIEQERRKHADIFNKINTFGKEVVLHNINMETIKTCSICGTSSRLVYTPSYDENSNEAKVSMMNIDPWETIFVYGDNENHLIASIRYLKTRAVVSNQVKELYKFEIYDNTNIYTVTQNSQSSFDEDTDVTVTPHLFGNVPLFEFVNNRERQGDCDKVLSLIDAYDRALSDLSSELEQFRLAYIALYGLKSNKENIDELKQTGMFEMTKDGKVEFVTKKVDIKGIIEYLDKLENNIIRFSKSVNFKDENFFGNLSGVAIRYKLMQLEEKSMTAQVKFEVSDSYMWRLLEPVFKKFNTEFDYKLIHRRFTRNIPVNMLEEARIQTELDGIVSTETRLSIASFIENPELEMQALQREKIENVKNGIDFANKESKVRVVDIDEGGISNRNTNGPVEDTSKK